MVKPPKFRWRWGLLVAAVVTLLGLLVLSRYQYSALKYDVASKDAANVALENQLSQARAMVEGQQAEFDLAIDAEHRKAVDMVNEMHDIFANEFNSRLRETQKRNGCAPSRPIMTTPGV